MHVTKSNEKYDLIEEDNNEIEQYAKANANAFVKKKLNTENNSNA